MTGGELEYTGGEQLFDLSLVYPLHRAVGSPRLHLMAALDELLMDFVLGSLPFVRIVPIRFVRPATRATLATRNRPPSIIAQRLWVWFCRFRLHGLLCASETRPMVSDIGE